MASEKNLKRLQREYWRRLTGELIDYYPEFRPKKGNGNTYYLPLGNKSARVSMSVNSIMGIQECRIIISNRPHLYNYLERNKEHIEKGINIKLTWEYMSDAKSYIFIFRDFDIRNEDSWDEAIKWHLKMASTLYFEFSMWISSY